MPYIFFPFLKSCMPPLSIVPQHTSYNLTAVFLHSTSSGFSGMPSGFLSLSTWDIDIMKGINQDTCSMSCFLQLCLLSFRFPRCSAIHRIIELQNLTGNLVSNIVKFPHFTDEETECSDFSKSEVKTELEFSLLCQNLGCLDRKKL